MNETYTEVDHAFKGISQFESREIAALLQEGAEKLSHLTQCAVFLSAPRFDHDFVISLKLVPLDASSLFMCIDYRFWSDSDRNSLSSYQTFLVCY